MFQFQILRHLKNRTKESAPLLTSGLGVSLWQAQLYREFPWECKRGSGPLRLRVVGGCLHLWQPWDVLLPFSHLGVPLYRDLPGEGERGSAVLPGFTERQAVLLHVLISDAVQRRAWQQHLCETRAFIRVKATDKCIKILQANFNCKHLDVCCNLK